MKKIVILDGYTLFNDDLSADILGKYGEVAYYERTPSELTADRIGDADIVLTNKTVIDRAVLDACPDIRYISVLATGYNVVDCAYAAAKGIPVSNVPAYSTDSVVQHTFALLLELCSGAGLHSASVARGEWCGTADFCYCLQPLVELSGKIFGIVGYGNIGKSVARVAQAFGMNVLVHNRTPFEGSVSFEYLMANSDVVSLHCPLTEQNKGLINERTLSLMKPGAFLINTSRGGLVEEKALRRALDEGIIAGAGLDVLSVEPARRDNPLLRAKNCIITPHIAWASFEARKRLLDVTVDNIANFRKGTPVNIIN